MASALDKLKNRAKDVPQTTPEVHVPLSKIRFDPKQPRQAFHHIDGKVAPKDEEYIKELAATIKAQGLIQAITLEEQGDGTYLVVVGECRTRAHMMLGLPTIRAVIRNDLSNPAARLAYQLIENVTRNDLSDLELAQSIATLMKGTDGAPPMKQVEIANMLAKSEGWVTRFVKFGDDELQRLWVSTGIAETPENVYRISILPTNAQVEIRRRVDLPSDHPEFLAKPVDRAVINEYALQAKIAKSVSSGKSAGTPPASPAGASGAAQPSNTGAAVLGNGVAPDDTTGQALANLAAEGQTQAADSIFGGPKEKIFGGPVEKYTLAAGARAAILNRVPAVSGKDIGTPPVGDDAAHAPVIPPVHCRASLSNVRALFALLEDHGKLGTVDDVACTFNFNGALAQEMANLLTGVVVDQREVPAVLQNELARLQVQQ